MPWPPEQHPNREYTPVPRPLLFIFLTSNTQNATPICLHTQKIKILLWISATDVVPLTSKLSLANGFSKDQFTALYGPTLWKMLFQNLPLNLMTVIVYMPFICCSGWSHSKKHHNPFPSLYTDGMLMGFKKSSENNDPWVEPSECHCYSSLFCTAIDFWWFFLLSFFQPFCQLFRDESYQENFWLKQAKRTEEGHRYDRLRENVERFTVEPSQNSKLWPPVDLTLGHSLHHGLHTWFRLGHVMSTP